MRNLAFVVVSFLVLFLVGCPDPPAKTAPAAATKTGKPVAGKTAAKTGEAKMGGGAETLQPVSKTGDGKVGIQASSVDPVCKMEVSITNPGATYNFGDAAYMFCSEQCAETFKANPKQYLRKD